MYFLHIDNLRTISRILDESVRTLYALLDVNCNISIKKCIYSNELSRSDSMKLICSRSLLPEKTYFGTFDLSKAVSSQHQTTSV